jgi:hypothetical protein
MASFSAHVAESHDDGFLANGNWSKETDEISIGFASWPWEPAFRFINVTIPKDSIISDARITVMSAGTNLFDDDADVKVKVYGIDEDNTATFDTSPFGRDHTTANKSWSFTIEKEVGHTDTSVDLSTIVQEIVNRGGWVSGNAMGFLMEENGSSSFGDVYAVDRNHSKCALLEVTYTPPLSTTTQTCTVKADIRNAVPKTVGAKGDLTGNITPTTRTRTCTAKAYLLQSSLYGVFVTKPTYDVLTAFNPSHFIFNSNFGTLKYHTSGTLAITIEIDYDYVAGSATYNHNLGYYPYVEAFVQLPTGEWEYMPSYGFGATTSWRITYKVTTTDIVFYAEETGFTDASITFNIKFFVFKNELKFT